MVDICLCACITCCWEIGKEVNDRCENPCGDNNDESGGNKYQPAATANVIPPNSSMSGTDMSRKLEF
jgi:hypothetical protein